MRNLKKLLAVIVAICVLATMVIPAFAAETKTDAETVEILGVLKGDGAGVTDTYLAKGTNRFQAALLYLRLIGLEDEALAEASTDNFEDASLVYVGGQKVLAYIKANPDLGWKGVNAAGTVFEPTNAASAQMIYKVMLEALGYKQDVDFTWADTITFAADKSLTKIADVTELTNNDLAIALVEALKAKVKDSDKTLLEKLIEDKVITEAAAIEAGLMEEAPEELKVESVTADNLKQLVVTFNQEIKEAGDNDNYEIETDGTATIDKDSDFSLQDDKKTVVITLTTAADENQDTVDLTVKDIESAKGVKMEEQTIEDIVLFDTTIPRALSAAVIGNDTIKVTFSEPIDPASVDGDDITVDGGDYIVQDDEDYPALVNNNTEVNFKLYSLLDEGKLTVEVGGGIEDYAGFSAAKKSFTLDVVEDTDAPVVTGYKDAKPGEITLIFNEDIEFVDADPDEDKFYHTNSKNAAKEVTISGKELKMTFAEGYELPLGTAHVYIEKEMIQDMWDNENAKIAYTVEVETDVTKPTLDKVEQDGDWEDQIILTFSESLDQDSAENVDNYTLLDKDGKVLEKISGALFALDDDDKVDDKKIIIVFDEELGGDYSIVVEKVEDLAGNAIEKVTKTFTIKDKDAPDFPSTSGSAVLYNPGEKDQMLKINFGEAMAITGTYSVLDLEKYQLDGKDLSDVDDATIKAINDNKAVEIKLPSKDGKNSFAVGDSLYIARVANAAGNKTTDMTSGEIIVGGSGKVEFDKAELTDKATIVVTLKDRLTTFKAADFTITDEDGDVTLKRVRHTVNSDGNSVVTFTVEDRSTESVDLSVISGATTESKNTYGETLVANTGIPVDDKAAPEVDEVFYAADGSAIYVVFKEAVDEDTFSTRSDAKNGFTISGGGELASALYLNSTTVELTAKDDKPFTKNTNVSYDGNYGITDKAGNKIAAFSRTDVLKAW